MALLVLNSEITIGSFQFRAVHDVRINRSIHSYMDTAVIEIPSISKIVQGKRSMPTRVTTADLITERDPVTIRLGYNGIMQTEFRGFVLRKNAGMPLQVECEGYGQVLREDLKYTAGSKSHPLNTTAKTLLEDMCKGSAVSVACPVDFPLKNFYATNANGLKVCDYIKQASDQTLTIFFIKPDVLWCGLVYTPYAMGNDPFNNSLVKYRMGYNVVKDSGLKLRVKKFDVQVIYNGKLANGTVVHTASKHKVSARKIKSLLNHVPDITTMKAFAQEKAYKNNYDGYEGKINAFLEPFCQPGYRAQITDNRYADRNGIYLVEGVNIAFGINGARRRVEVGPKIGFDNG